MFQGRWQQGLAYLKKPCWRPHNKPSYQPSISHNRYDWQLPGEAWTISVLRFPDLFHCLELSQESLGSSLLVWHLEWLWHGLFCFPIPKIHQGPQQDLLLFPLKWSPSRYSYGCHSYVAHKIIEDLVDLPGCGDMVIVDAPFGFALLWSDCS